MKCCESDLMGPLGCPEVNADLWSNHGLDCRVYALAARRLLAVNLSALAKRRVKKATERKRKQEIEAPEGPPDEEDRSKTKQRPKKRFRLWRGGGWRSLAVWSGSPEAGPVWGVFDL